MQCRIHWAHDGNEIMTGRSHDWTEALFLVFLGDIRQRGSGVWLERRDVVRHDDPVPEWWQRRVQLDAERRARRRRRHPMPQREEPNF